MTTHNNFQPNTPKRVHPRPYKCEFYQGTFFVKGEASEALLRFALIEIDLLFLKWILNGTVPSQTQNRRYQVTLVTDEGAPYYDIVKKSKHKVYVSSRTSDVFKTGGGYGSCN